MTLRWIEGFDSYGTQDPGVGLPTKYPVSSLGTTPTFDTGRNSPGRCLNWDGAGLSTPTLSSHATYIVGVAFQDVDVPTGASFKILRIKDGVTSQGGLLYSKTGASVGHFALTTPAGGLLGTGTTAIALGSWYYIEFKLTVSPSSGVAELKINGSTELSYTSINTQTTTNTSSNTITFSGSSGNGTILLDDIYILDGAGAVNNTYLGDSVVETIFPNGAGNSTGWTPNTGANYAAVGQTTPDGDTTYVEASSANKDTHAVTDLSLVTSNIAGVKVNLLARNTDGTSHTLSTVTRHSTTDYNGSTQTLASTAYTSIGEVYETNPGTSAAWTVSDVNADEFGYRFIA